MIVYYYKIDLPELKVFTTDSYSFSNLPGLTLSSVF